MPNRVVIVAISVIAVLEIIAMILGLNGAALASALAMIAGLGGYSAGRHRAK